MIPRVNCDGFPGTLSGVLRKCGLNFLKRLPPNVQISIIATTDSEMTRMNRQFRSKNMTTDVLTFVDADLVEIYISLPVARKQARARRITVGQECLRLLVHGLCHAMGMDHHSREDFIEMRRREFEVLVQCDIA